MLNRVVFILIYNFIVLIFIPVFITLSFGQKNIDNQENEQNNQIEVINYIEVEQEPSNTNIIENKNNLDEYLVGVLAAEVPASFEEDALKAQAIAARTYAYRRIDSINDNIDHTKIGQAYNSLEQMKQKWGNNFEQYYNKMRQAVYSTQGIIITYQNEPIEAVFHSTSAGITETAENIWGKSLPYIKSVDSNLDENAPDFIYSTKISNTDFINKISSKLNNIDKNKIIETFKIKNTSEAGYVLNVEICGETLSGRDIRTIFGLRSTNFTINKQKDYIEFTTKGYGHGAGLSQYGANFMAKEGKTYEEILTHYYTDVQLTKVY